MSDLLANQVAKVTRFADFLDAHLGHVLELDQMKSWGDQDWATVTERFNETRTDGRTDTPPRSTRRSIYRTLVLRRREAACDPFAGIGTNG